MINDVMRTSFFTLAIAILGVILGLYIGDLNNNEKSAFLAQSGFTLERNSPSDWVAEDKIKIYKDKVVIEIPYPILAKFANTNSMDPVIDETANAIEIVPTSPEQIKPGDIISYSTEIGNVVHRVVAIGYDDMGWYAITQGDNNSIPDRAKVRWDQVKRVVVAVIY